MTRQVLLVPGIRTFDWERTMGPLHAALSRYGVETEVADYGYILAPLDNGRARRAIREKAKPGCVLVGYSNGGAAAIAEAGEIEAHALVLISPAARVDAEYPDPVSKVRVYFSPGDGAIRTGGVIAWVADRTTRRGSAGPHPWGRLGIDGPDTSDERVKGIEMGEQIAHSWFQHDEKVRMIARDTARMAQGVD